MKNIEESLSKKVRQMILLLCKDMVADLDSSFVS